MNTVSPSTLRALVVAVSLAWLTPRAGRAEGSVSYKYEDYRESGGRITVRTQGAYAEQTLGFDSRIKVDGVLDAVAGATPTGEPAPAGSDRVPLSRLVERRKAWNAELSHQFSRINVALGAGNSRESDYVSNGWSINTVTGFNQQNTELLAGVAGTRDRIDVFYASNAPAARKRTSDVIVGIRQLLDPRTSVGLSVSWGGQRGYLSDPYKLVQKSFEVFPGVFLPRTFPENRPAGRDKWIVLATLNRAFPAARGAVDASYRYYRDTFGTDAHTLDVAWFQRLGDRVILRPAFRLYDQTAASFYAYSLEGTSVAPVSGPPRPQGPFYSSDHRLSALRTYTYGLKLVWDITPALQFDVALGQYVMRGKDGVTPRSAYSDARIVTAGLRCAW